MYAAHRLACMLSWLGSVQVGNRIIRKRIHVRVEHVAPSRCKEEFLRRQKLNDQLKHDAHVAGGTPRPGVWMSCCVELGAGS